MKDAKDRSWNEITQPLVDAMAKTDMKEEDVVGYIHKLRKEKKI